MSSSVQHVRIREVGPRDGFQNEPEVIATADKVRLIEMLARTGLRRLGHPDEVAAAIAFLASDDASYVTGQSLGVSGGLARI